MSERDLQHIGMGAVECVAEMVASLRAAEESDEGTAEYEGETLTAEEIQERIHEDPLSVEVRSDWHSPGSEDRAESQYKILLGTGGPATQIIGELNEWGQPESAEMQAQDWFTPWETTITSSEQDDALLVYANQFYFGE